MTDDYLVGSQHKKLSNRISQIIEPVYFKKIDVSQLNIVGTVFVRSQDCELG